MENSALKVNSSFFCRIHHHPVWNCEDNPYTLVSCSRYSIISPTVLTDLPTVQNSWASIPNTSQKITPWGSCHLTRVKHIICAIVRIAVRYCRFASLTINVLVWSNFEIGDMNFWRGEAYTKFFEYLDSQGGFYYEVHHHHHISLFLSLFMINLPLSGGETPLSTASQHQFSPEKTRFISLKILDMSILLSRIVHWTQIHGKRAVVRAISRRVLVSLSHLHKIARGNNECRIDYVGYSCMRHWESAWFWRCSPLFAVTSMYYYIDPVRLLIALSLFAAYLCCHIYPSLEIVALQQHQCSGSIYTNTS